MLASIAVLEHNVECGQVVEDEARRAVRARDGRVLPQAHLGEDRGDDRGVVGDHVEHGVIRAVLHRVEEDLELDRAVRRRERNNLNRNEREVVHIVVLIDEAEVGERRGGGVRDR